MPRHRIILALIVIAAPLLAQTDELWVTVNESAKLRKFWGVDELKTRKTKLSDLRLAVISRGYVGVGNDDTKYLPKGTEIVGDQSAVPRAQAKFGRQAAQIAWAVAGYEASGPAIRLYDGATPGLLEEAIEGIKSWRPDVVLSTENLEGYGNFDGKGVLNARIEELVKLTDTVWIQSAGTYRGRARNAPVTLVAGKKASEKVVQFGKGTGINLFVREEKTDVQLTLSWNANRRTVTGKGKDLDLYLYSTGPKGELIEPPVAKSTLTQVTASGAGEGKTVFPVEQLLAEGLAASDQAYQVVVKYKSGEFDPNNDSVRVTMTTDKEPSPGEDGKFYFPVELEGAESYDNIMVPSDNAYVFTIGDQSPWSSLGEVKDHVAVRKPDLILDWIKIPFSDGGASPMGPHLAAASLAGVAIRMKSVEPNFGVRHMRALVRKMQTERQANRAPRDLRTAKEDLKKEGWKFDAKEVEAVLKNCGRSMGLPMKLDFAMVAAKAHDGGGCGYIGLRKNMADVPFLSSLPEYVKVNARGYRVFMYPHTTKDGFEYRFALHSSPNTEWPWTKSTDVNRWETVELKELEYYENSRDFTKSTSLRWATPTEAELKTLVD